ncbi:MAG TPA: chemotaxis protein CheB [Gemmatimonadaceae bacterium]|jgi:two-component system chemotaxis response regulator CheB
MQTRDIIVIGASMGGVEALSNLVGQLPANLPASIFVVQHTSPESPGLLAHILDNRGPLRASNAESGMPVERGRIYVAPPNRHLLLTEDGIHVVFGARENRSRPAVDPLFRTAAVNYGSRVIGVVLTGLLGDGASGLLAVEACGGVPIVQAPSDAAYPEMPTNALAYVNLARQIPLAEMGEALVRLSKEQAPDSPAVPEVLRLEASLTERAMETDDWNQVPGTPTRFTCPECMGAIQEIRENGMARYRCRVGHAYSADDMVREKAKSLENTLWIALQTLEERAQMLETMAKEHRAHGWMRGSEAYASRARETRVHGDELRELLASLGTD